MEVKARGATILADFQRRLTESGGEAVFVGVEAADAVGELFGEHGDDTAGEVDARPALERLAFDPRVHRAGGVERRSGGTVRHQLDRPEQPAAAYVADVRVVADDENNSLMIYATGNQYRKIEVALEQLDVVATQVLSGVGTTANPQQSMVINQSLG